MAPSWSVLFSFPGWGWGLLLENVLYTDDSYKEEGCARATQILFISVPASWLFPGIYQSVGSFCVWFGILVFTGPHWTPLVPERAPHQESASMTSLIKKEYAQCWAWMWDSERTFLSFGVSRSSWDVLRVKWENACSCGMLATTVQFILTGSLVGACSCAGNRGALDGGRAGLHHHQPHAPTWPSESGQSLWAPKPP